MRERERENKEEGMGIYTNASILRSSSLLSRSRPIATAAPAEERMAILLCPVLTLAAAFFDPFSDIDSRAWPGLEETALSSSINHHVGAFLRILSEDDSETSSESMDQELALSRSVDAMAKSLESTSVSSEETRQRQAEYERECRERISTVKEPPVSEVADAQSDGIPSMDSKMSDSTGEAANEADCSCNGNMLTISYQRNVTVVYELTSACLADLPEDDKKDSRPQKGL